MQAFTVDEGRPEEFVARVERAVQERGFEDIASISLDGDVLIVAFSWIGKTSLTYQICRENGGFSATLGRQKVSAFHAPFKGGFEERFDQIMTRVGARSR